MMLWQQPTDETIAAVVDTVRRFCKEKVEPVRDACEERSEFPKSIVNEMGAAGWFGLMIPEEYGGSGMNTTAASYVARELAYWWPSLHLIWTANSSLAAFPIMYAGTAEQKQRTLPRLASGAILGCFALTETEAGSDAKSLRSRAVRTKDGWILNGSKVFITNALHASISVVFAQTSAGISAFVIESDSEGLAYPGVSVRYLPKRLLKSSDFCALTFYNVALPESALLGAEGSGFDIAMKTLDGGRINIAAQAIGMAMRVVDDAMAYTKVRKQFGKPVYDNGMVRRDFVRAHRRLEKAWKLVLDASAARDRGENITLIAARAKLVATEVSARTVFDIATYFGGMAATTELPVLQRVLDVFITRVYEGANNIQKMIIAREMEKQKQKR